MARFVYTAKSKLKQNISGYIEAESEQDAINKITSKGYFPLSIKSEEVFYNERPSSTFFRKISSSDIVLFTRQLASLVEAGVNILNSLDIINRQTSNKYLKIVLGDVINKIKDGRPLSESFSQEGSLFSNFYCSMIRTGEASGNLKGALNRLSGFLEKEQDFKNSLLSTLTYPLFVLVVGVLVVFVLLVFVIPALLTMFKDMGQILPLPTRILIGITDFLHNYGWILVVLIIGAIFLLHRAYRNPQIRLWLDRFKLKMVLWGEIILKTEISRLMRSLSLLTSSGMPITPALEISASILENKVLISETEKFKEEIKNGASLSEIFENSKIFPEFVRHIVAIGEETGSLDKSLTSIANDYEQEIERTLKTFSRLLEPVIILVVGLVVGFIVLSMMLPIFEINFLVK